MFREILIGEVLVWKHNGSFVEANGDKHSFAVKRGARAIVVDAQLTNPIWCVGPAVDVVWEEGPLNPGQSPGRYGLGWFEDTEASPLAVSRVASTRAGYPVTNVKECDDDLTAEIRGMTLHFGRDGRFMPGHDNPIDPVEAQ